MASSKVYGGGSNMNTFLQHDKLPPSSSSSSEGFDSLWIPTSSPAFHGSKSMINFEDIHGGDTTDRPYSLQQFVKEEENGDEDFDGCFHPPGKKRRLTSDQVLYLERNFDMENKLEPDRKVELAKELGLQPRQVAIWFQNRRARFKTKQLEKDYDSLRASYNILKADYDSVFKHNENLKDEVLLLKDRLLLKEESPKPEASDPINSSPAEPKKNILNADSANLTNAAVVVCKQEDATSSDSSHCTDRNHSSMLEPADSSNVFEPDQSDFSQDEEDNLIDKSLLPPLYFPKLEDGCYHDDLSANSSNFGFLAEDQPFWLLHY